MSPFNPRDPETQWDEHHRPGHPRPRESKSQEAQLNSEVVHGGNGAVKRGMRVKLGIPGYLEGDTHGDGTLRDSVQKALDNDENVGGYGLEADVVQGVARVVGVVDTLKDKLHAAKVVTAIDGVTGFEDGISISTDGAITDQGVQMEVSEEIGDIPGLRDSVGVKVSGGVAYLMGRVRSKDEEAEAIRAAETARGVTKVVSQLKVVPVALDTDDSDELFHSQVGNDKDGRGLRK